MNEFIVDSKGHCFLCLKQISPDFGSDSYCGPNSFQYLARYLHLDMKKVFYEGDHDIAPQLLDKVQKSKMKVELCEVCTKLNNSFSSAYRQLEKSRLVVRSKLDLIHRRMLHKEEHTIIDNMLSKILTSDGNPKEVGEDLAAKLKIMDVLRNETVGKCSLMLSNTKPRVKIQKLTSEELLLIDKAKSKYEYKQLSCADLESGPQIKTETIHDQLNSELDGDNSFTGYDADESEYNPTHLTTDSGTNEKFNSTDSKRKAKGKLTQSRYQCDKCDKSVVHPTHVKRHKLVIHFGQRIPCDKCSRTFTERFTLRRHQLSMHFGKTFPCLFCSKTFTQAFHRSFHQKNKCPGRKSVQ